MPWNDDDLREWIEANLGFNTREDEIQAALDRRQWDQKALRSGKGNLNEVNGDVRCYNCRIPTARRYLDLRGICYRCRKPEERKIEIEKKLKHVQWYFDQIKKQKNQVWECIAEIERLQECIKNWEAQNPDMLQILKSLSEK